MTSDDESDQPVPAANEAKPARPAPLGATLLDAMAFRALLVPNGRLFGLDLGTKTIGIALSDVTRIIASSFETLARGKVKADAAILSGLMAKHGVIGLVVGLPINMDGSDGPRAQSTRAFCRNLNQLLSHPILLWDERMTTAEATRMLIQADTSRQRRGELIDKLAATIILQSALDCMR